MDFRELIDQRRSVREYAAAIDHETLTAILREAQQAPSWKNQQASRCYAVLSDEKVAELRERALPPFNQHSSRKAALLVTTYVKDLVGFSGEGEPVNEIGNGWGAYDLGLHDAYLILAAADAGLDTLIMGIRDADAIREILDIPENEEIMSVIAVGTRAEEPVLRPRKELDEVLKIY